jgi:hypothetical protein
MPRVTDKTKKPLFCARGEMRGFALLPLLLLFAVAEAGAPRPFRLHLARGEYGELYVGNPGRPVRVRLRWDTSEVVLLADRSYSSSYSAQTAGISTRPGFSPGDDASWPWWMQDGASVSATELFYFGPDCLRLPVTYVSGLAGTGYEPQDSTERVSHEGLLGLGPASPLWRHWTSWRWTSSYLDLMPASKDAVASPPGGVSAERLLLHSRRPRLRLCAALSAQGERECFNATLRHDRDWTSLEASLYERARTASRAADDPVRASLSPLSCAHAPSRADSATVAADAHAEHGCPGEGAVEAQLWPDMDFAYDANDAPRSTLRYLTRDEDHGGSNSGSERSLGQDEDGWQDQAHVGRDRLHRSVLAASLPEQLLSAQSADAGDTDMQDYLWAWLAGLGLLLVWFPGCYQPLHRARSGVPFDWLFGGGFETEHHTHVAWSATRGGLLSLFVLAHFGLRSESAFEAFADVAARDPSRAPGWSSHLVYWALWAGTVALPVFLVPWYRTRHSRIAAESVVACAAPASLAYALWLLLCSSFSAAFNPLLMLFLAAFFFMCASELSLRLIYAVLCGATPVGTRVPRLGPQQGAPRPRVADLDASSGSLGGALWLAWSLLQLAVSGWFFAFFSLAAFFDRSWPGHPDAGFVLAGTAAATWFVGALVPFANEQLALLASASRASAYSITASLGRLAEARAASLRSPTTNAPAQAQIGARAVRQRVGNAQAVLDHDLMNLMAAGAVASAPYADPNQISPAAAAAVAVPEWMMHPAQQPSVFSAAAPPAPGAYLALKLD